MQRISLQYFVLLSNQSLLFYKGMVQEKVQRIFSVHGWKKPGKYYMQYFPGLFVSARSFGAIINLGVIIFVAVLLIGVLGLK